MFEQSLLLTRYLLIYLFVIYLFIYLASSFLIHSSFLTTVSSTTLGSLHLTVRSFWDLYHATPYHWSPSASHLTLASGSRGFL